MLLGKKPDLKSGGQSLVEALIAVAVVIVLVTGIVAGTTSSLRAGAYSRARSEATKLTREALEIARNDRDSNWSGFAALGSTKSYYCAGSSLATFIDKTGKSYTDDISATSGCETDGKVTITANSLSINFIRFVIIQQDPRPGFTDDETVWVKAVVRWREGDSWRTSSAETYLNYW